MPAMAISQALPQAGPWQYLYTPSVSLLRENQDGEEAFQQVPSIWPDCWAVVNIRNLRWQRKGTPGNSLGAEAGGFLTSTVRFWRGPGNPNGY